VKTEFLEPRELTAGVTRNVMLLVGADVPLEAVATWTRMELLVAYDWAMREHLTASDSRLRRREMPTFVRGAATRAPA
jgi:hypothetical protein